MKAIDKARRDSRISSLLSDISSNTKLKYTKSKNDGWGCNYSNGAFIISYSGCNHPSAALAHELLHVKTQLNGYKRIRIGISSIDQTESFIRFMTCLDNELQHHKFYNEFIMLGFEPHQFYCDSDIETEAYICGEINNGYKKLIDAVICLFSIIAPGGTMPNTTIDVLKQQLFSVNDGVYKGSLQKIEKAVNNWAQSPSFDAVQTVKNILLSMEQTNNLTWFGFDAADKTPSNGFYVDMPFEVNDPTI